jgi:hypothetical protein
MRKIIVLTFVTLDGVMQAPGGPQEDTDGGFLTHSAVTPGGVIVASYARSGEVKTGLIWT